MNGEKIEINGRELTPTMARGAQQIRCDGEVCGECERPGGYLTPEQRAEKEERLYDILTMFWYGD